NRCQGIKPLAGFGAKPRQRFNLITKKIFPSYHQIKYYQKMMVINNNIIFASYSIKCHYEYFIHNK
ncbi:MAG: hypothetical protein ACOCWC_05640, partial [Bacteroidota bacterium]